MIILFAIALVLTIVLLQRLAIFYAPLLVIGWLAYEWFDLTLSGQTWLYLAGAYIIGAVVLGALAPWLRVLADQRERGGRKG